MNPSGVRLMCFMCIDHDDQPRNPWSGPTHCMRLGSLKWGQADDQAAAKNCNAPPV